jgi:type II secretory pathway pseudopilin PulG
MQNIFLKKRNNTNRAFTLIEFLIYFSILAILTLVIGSLLFQILSNRTKLATLQEINQNARMAMDQITTYVHNAQSINSPTPGQNASSLSLTFADVNKNPTLFNLSSGILQITQGGTGPVAIGTNETFITNISFTNVSYPDTPGAIRITLSIRSASESLQQEYNHSETFYTTATIRPK